MRKLSGNVEINDKLTCFLYILLRDEFPAGKLESIMDIIDDVSFPILFTNGWLAKYAENLAERIRR